MIDKIDKINKVKKFDCVKWFNKFIDYYISSKNMFKMNKIL